TKHFVVHFELVVILRVHEVVRITTLIEKLQFVRFHRCFFDGIRRTETMLEVGTRAQVLELRLHHCTQVARCMMTELNDTARIALEYEDHAASDLCCRNSHGKCGNSGSDRVKRYLEQP